MSAKVLLVDDDASVREALVFSLEEQGYEVTPAENGDAALAALARQVPDLVITDLRMPGMSGLDLVREVAARSPGLPQVVITAYGSVDTAVDAMKAGAVDFLTKPVSREVLRLTVERTLRAARLAVENQALRTELEGEDRRRLIAVSPAMSELLAMVDRVAATDATVLLTGESGTGKELIARRLHERSRRKDGPWVALNCSALPRELLESELFGHERGAFTGATRSRKGRFVEASGGTLFLDEIGDLDLDLQAKLLRVLQEREVEVVGGGSTPVDVRVVAATHRDLRARVEEGQFREDLFFRLHVVPVHLPPLRERQGDVRALFRQFFEHQFQLAGQVPAELEPALLDELERRPWPGNVRELQNVATRLALTATGATVGPADLLPTDGQGAGRVRGAPDPEQSGDRPLLDEGVLRLPEGGLSLEALERAAVVAALAATGGNRARAARFLRVPRHVLLYRIDKFGVTDDEILAAGGRPEAPVVDKGSAADEGAA